MIELNLANNFYALSNQGLVRSNNEDNILLFELPEIKAVVMIAADGMGGHNKGELASKIAVNSAFRRLPQELNGNNGSLAILEKMIYIVERANIDVYNASLLSSSNSGMGTTLTIALIINEELLIAHIGDCRLYCVRNRSLKLLTVDHTYSNEINRGSIYSSQTLDKNVTRHILTRALGSPVYMPADAYKYTIKPGDRFLLSTDGLYGYVPERQILKIISDSSNAKDCAIDLIDAANNAGGHDNVSVITAFV